MEEEEEEEGERRSVIMFMQEMTESLGPAAPRLDAGRGKGFLWIW